MTGITYKTTKVEEHKADIPAKYLIEALLAEWVSKQTVIGDLFHYTPSRVNGECSFFYDDVNDLGSQHWKFVEMTPVQKEEYSAFKTLINIF